MQCRSTPKGAWRRGLKAVGGRCAGIGDVHLQPFRCLRAMTRDAARLHAQNSCKDVRRNCSSSSPAQPGCNRQSKSRTGSSGPGPMHAVDMHACMHERARDPHHAINLQSTCTCNQPAINLQSTCIQPAFNLHSTCNPPAIN